MIVTDEPPTHIHTQMPRYSAVAVVLAVMAACVLGLLGAGLMHSMQGGSCPAPTMEVRV